MGTLSSTIVCLSGSMEYLQIEGSYAVYSPAFSAVSAPDVFFKLTDSHENGYASRYLIILVRILTVYQETLLKRIFLKLHLMKVIA